MCGEDTAVVATGKRTGPIDAHVHVWTDDRVGYPRQPGAPDYSPPRFTPEDFLACAGPNGVTRAVLVQVSFYGSDNSYLLDSLNAHPGVFSGIAFVSDKMPDPGAAMAMLVDRGVRGFRIVPGGAPGTWLDAPGMAAMWAFGADREVALCPLINADALPAVGRMCARFPDTPVVIDHLARIGLDGVIRDADVRLLCSLAAHREVYVKVSAFYALSRKHAPYTDLSPMIRRVFEVYGPKRLMWASDSPFQTQGGHTYKDSLALIAQYLDFLTSADREWILSKTAESVFF
jgi:predicted TIM-barrel fold metal-dependent hydrolase